MRGFLSSVLGLIVLQAVVTTGSGRVGQAFTGLAAVIDHVVNPNVPAIPDLRTRGASVAPSASIAPAQIAPAGLTTTRPAAPTVPGAPSVWV